ncbi:hypothetical protein BDZ45DRAFT_803556 [Acephala macrosclerotiorum]|nr:hypothetical protein BDZ45DRAFT_803556 [Acephala macrosclerotiorum]
MLSSLFRLNVSHFFPHIVIFEGILQVVFLVEISLVQLAIALSKMLPILSSADVELPSVSIDGRTLEAISARRAARFFGAIVVATEMESEKQK